MTSKREEEQATVGEGGEATENLLFTRYLGLDCLVVRYCCKIINDGLVGQKSYNLMKLIFEMTPGIDIM